jgi:hypothetical protein
MDTFWSEYIWLPPNTTWQDIAPESSTEIQHPDYRHLFYPLPMALVMLYLRYVLEKWVEVMSGGRCGSHTVRVAGTGSHPWESR